MSWVVYILGCCDGTLYTGCTNDLERRLKQHNAGKGAKYTRARLPVIVLASFPVTNRSEAGKEEYRIKQLSRKEKLDLIVTYKKSKNE